MREHWRHGELGAFEYEWDGWKKAVDLPEFRAFRFNREFHDEPLFELKLEAEPDELPSTGVIAVALKLVANQQKLVESMKESLWGDFHGREPNSGMWWHGNLDAVNEVLTAEFGKSMQLQEQVEVLAIMVPTVVNVRKWVLGHDKPVAEIYFFAAFEQEHGVGILTDGDVVLGIGYSGEARPFNPES